MAFVDDIKTCMLTDSALNALVTGGIYYDNTPPGADSAKSWIIYDYDKTGSEDTVAIKDAVVYYDLEVQIITTSVSKNKEIFDALYNYLMSYSASKVRDVSLSEENKIEQDYTTKLYYKTDIYKVTYDRI